MFDISSSELLLVAVVAVLIIGPKDLPRALYKLGQVVGKARGMARHFRTGLDTMVREAELEELQKQWDTENARIMAANPVARIKDEMKPLADEIKDVAQAASAPAILPEATSEPTLPLTPALDAPTSEPAPEPAPAAEPAPAPAPPSTQADGDKGGNG